MAVAVAVGSIVANDPAAGLDRTRASYIVEGTLTLSGNYGTGSSHGDTVDFASDKVKSNQPPKWVDIREDQGAGNAPLGFKYTYNSGTTQSNGVLTITGTGASSGQGGTEITEGSAYSGFTPSLNGAVLRFRAEFPML